MPTTQNRIVAEDQQTGVLRERDTEEAGRVLRLQTERDRLGTWMLPLPNTFGWSKKRNSARRANAIVASAR